MGTVLENLLVVVLTLLTVLAFGALVRRLLGVRVGWIRTVLFALVAFLLAQALLTAMLPVDETDPVTVILFLALAVCCASLLAMVGVVLAEVIVPEGSLPGPIELWRSWRMRVARTRRYVQILRIAGRHGLGRFLRGQRHSGLESSLFRRDLARHCGGRWTRADHLVSWVTASARMTTTDLSSRADVLLAGRLGDLARGVRRTQR